jgi:SAM (Sterile alpha motif) domain-containing protein/adenylate/guanylate cyclase family protein
VDVETWLQSLGLERYAPAFRDNDVDAEVLLKLTADDLISIGVTSVGHRRKLLDAIAALSAAVPGTPATAALRDARAQADAERRQLTVMFCDLVGSTALSTRFDPEDLREVIAAYHRAVAEVVTVLDGFVAKYMGDGVLVYFGYPRAHEDDAERAVRAGLGSIDAVGRLDVKSAKPDSRVPRSRFAPDSPVEGAGFEPSVPLASGHQRTTDRVRRDAPRGVRWPLIRPDLPEPTVQQGDDFLLNLRIVQQTQERLFESLALLCLLDLVFSFGSLFHGSIMSEGSSAERPSAVMPQT